MSRARPARKRFGQHFLEPAWVDKLIRAIEPRPDQAFIEIGPGRGALTRPLAARAREVIAYEIDRDLVSDLRDAAPPNVTVVEGDFLDTFARRPPALAAATRVAGNLPYNVASPIMFALVDAFAAGAPLVDATLMLQLEVAERLVAKPGTKEYGVLTVLIGHCADVDLLLKLPAGAFRPPPKVRSAVVRLRFHPPEPAVRDRRMFERLVQSVFTHRRKTLANALRAVPNPQAASQPDSEPGTMPAPRTGTMAGIDLRRRPETLTVAEFAVLADLLSSP